MTQDGIIREKSTQYTPDPVLLSVKRHINMGERSFQNAETKLYAHALPTLSIQLEVLREIREALNTWELEERANYMDMQQTIAEQESAMEEATRFKEHETDAKFRIELMDYINENPSCGIDDLVLNFELSRYEINNHLDSLVNQGKIKHAECRLSFLINEDGFAEEDEDDIG